MYIRSRTTLSQTVRSVQAVESISNGDHSGNHLSKVASDRRKHAIAKGMRVGVEQHQKATVGRGVLHLEVWVGTTAEEKRTSTYIHA